MKKRHRLSGAGLFLFLVLGTGCATTSVSSEYEARWPNNQLKRKGRMVDGIQEGIWVHYYESGAKRCEGSYKDDAQDGAWTYWYDNGQKEMEGSFVNERRSGPWTYWYKDGSLRARGTFVDGREDGQWSFFAPGGSLQQRGDFAGAQPALSWTTFDRDGKLRSEGFYLRGRKVGTWRSWDASGGVTETNHPLPEGHQLVHEDWPGGGARRQGFVQGTRPTGRWVSFHRNGKRRMVVDLDADATHGWCHAYRDDGGLFASGPMKGGRPTGDWRVWDSDDERDLVWNDVRMPLPPFDQLSDASIVESMPADEVVDVWLSEISRSPERLSSAVGAPPADTADPTVSTIATASVDVRTEREELPQAPIRAQPWTVREETGMESFLENYGTGQRSGLSRISGRYRRTTGTSASSRGNEKLATALLGKPLPLTVFEAADGGTIDLKDYEGRRNVLLVILRGFAGQVCVYCEAQTRALAPSAATFAELDTEVLVVYPGPKRGLEAFEEAYRSSFGVQPPESFRFLYDQDLVFVRSLGIDGDLADPSCLLLDKNGKVEYAYVGLTRDDRPDARRLIKQCEKLRE